MKETSYRAYRWRAQRWTLECDLCSDHCQIIVIYYNNFKQINWVLSTPSTIYHPRSMIHLPKGEIINPFINIKNSNPDYYYFGLMTIHQFNTKKQNFPPWPSLNYYKTHRLFLQICSSNVKNCQFSTKMKTVNYWHNAKYKCIKMQHKLFVDTYCNDTVIFFKLNYHNRVSLQLA